MTHTAYIARQGRGLLLATLLGVLPAAGRADQVTYADTIRPIFQTSCLNCHNPDKQKAGLDLTTYETAMAGGDSGKAIDPGNSTKSLIYRLLMHEEEPAMPRGGDKLPDSQLDLIKRWIDSGAPDKSGGMIAKSSSSSSGITVQPVDQKPKGPPPMPHDLLLEPVVHARRPGAIAGLAASPWAPLVAVTGQHQVLLYNAANLSIVGVLPFPEGFPQVLRFSRDGSLLIAGGGIGARSGLVVIWDVVTGRRVTQVGSEFDTVLAADISPDHSLVALGGSSKIVKIFSTKDGALLHKMKKHTDWVTAVSFTPDGKSLLSADRAGGLVAWDTQGRELATLPGHKSAITAIATFSNLIATSGEDGQIKLWDIAEAKEIKSWDAHKYGALSVNFTDDGKIVSCGRDRVARIWDLNGDRLQEFGKFPDIAMQTVFAAGRVIAGDWSGAVYVWTPDGKRVGGLDANPLPIADRLDAISKRLAQLEPAEAADLTARAAAENAARAADADAVSAADAVKAAQQAAQTADAKLAAAEKALELADSESATVQDPVLTGTQSSAPTAASPSPTPISAQDVATAGQEAAKAKETLAQLTQALADKQAAAKDADTALAKTREDEAANALLLRNARYSQKRWQAAAVNVQVFKARDELAARQTDYDNAVAAAKSAGADLDKARADLIAAQQFLANAPAILQQRQAAILSSSNALAAANNAVVAAKSDVEQKSAMAQEVSALATKLQTTVAASPSDANLAAAASKAGESAGLIAQALAAAQTAVTARESDASQAVANLAATQKALAQATADIASAPQKIPQLKSGVTAAENRTAGARAQAAALVESAAGKLAAAKANADNLAGQYQALAHPPKAAATPLTVASKK